MLYALSSFTTLGFDSNPSPRKTTRTEEWLPTAIGGTGAQRTGLRETPPPPAPPPPQTSPQNGRKPNPSYDGTASSTPPPDDGSTLATIQSNAEQEVQQKRRSVHIGRLKAGHGVKSHGTRQE